MAGIDWERKWHIFYGSLQRFADQQEVKRQAVAVVVETARVVGVDLAAR